MKSSPGCWSVYGEILAREYSNPAYFEVHRLTVDAYAVQHPGSTDRQSIHSVGLHLIRLCLFLEHGLSVQNANTAMVEAGRLKHTFRWLNPPGSLGKINAADVAKTKNVDDHKAMVYGWAQDAWEAWSIHHQTIRSWLQAKPRI